jgi:hypothetical protein
VVRLDRIGLGMTPLERERVEVAPIVEKMVENRLRWFGHVKRRVDHMEESQMKRGKGRPRKTIRKDLEINELDPCSRPHLVG